ncbi:unnamed protein product, partial [Ectocarpus fasciculatus]
MDFNSSTHRRHWLFTKETLRQVQEETAKLAAEACAGGTPPEGSRSFAVMRSTAGDKTGKKVTMKEEATSEVKGEGGVPATKTGEGDSD